MGPDRPVASPDKPDGARVFLRIGCLDIGSATILYANVHRFADYLIIKGSADDSCFAGRHHRYTLDYSKVKLTKR